MRGKMRWDLGLMNKFLIWRGEKYKSKHEFKLYNFFLYETSYIMFLINLFRILIRIYIIDIVTILNHKYNIRCVRITI